MSSTDSIDETIRAEARRDLEKQVEDAIERVVDLTQVGRVTPTRLVSKDGDFQYPDQRDTETGKVVPGVRVYSVGALLRVVRDAIVADRRQAVEAAAVDKFMRDFRDWKADKERKGS